jgi:sulfatase maturation enzyme AslB (radical SAM superfamily)
MINTLLDHFERASFDLILDLNVVDMEPYHFLRCVMLRMGATHLTLLEDLGKLENKCSFCRRPNAKRICGDCHLYHYCNGKCAKQDWAQHKPECMFLRKHSICALQEKFHLIVKK